MENTCCNTHTIHFASEKSQCSNPDKLSFNISNPTLNPIVLLDEIAYDNNLSGIDAGSFDNNSVDYFTSFDLNQLPKTPGESVDVAIMFDYEPSDCCPSESGDEFLEIVALKKEGESLPASSLDNMSDFGSDSQFLINSYEITVYHTAKLVDNDKLAVITTFKLPDSHTGPICSFDLNLDIYAVDECFGGNLSNVIKSDESFSVRKLCGEIIASDERIEMDGNIYPAAESYKLLNTNGVPHIVVVEYDFISLPDSIALIPEKRVGASGNTGNGDCDSNTVDSPVESHKVQSYALNRTGRVPSNLPADGMSEELSGKGMLYFEWNTMLENETLVRPYVRGWKDYAEKSALSALSNCDYNTTQFRLAVHCPIPTSAIPNGPPQIRLIESFTNYTGGFDGYYKFQIDGGTFPMTVKFRANTQTSSTPYKDPTDCSNKSTNYPAGGNYEFDNSGVFYETVINSAAELDSNRQIILPRVNESPANVALQGTWIPECIDIDPTDYDYDDEFLILGNFTSCNGFCVQLWDSSHLAINALPESYNIGTDVMHGPSSPSINKTNARNRLFDTIPFVFTKIMNPRITLPFNCAQEIDKITIDFKELPVGMTDVVFTIQVVELDSPHTPIGNTSNYSKSDCDISDTSGSLIRQSNPATIATGPVASDAFINNIKSAVDFNVTALKKYNSEFDTIEYQVVMENVPACTCSLYELKLEGKFTSGGGRETDISFIERINRPCNRFFLLCGGINTPKVDGADGLTTDPVMIQFPNSESAHYYLNNPNPAEDHFTIDTVTCLSGKCLDSIHASKLTAMENQTINIGNTFNHPLPNSIGLPTGSYEVTIRNTGSYPLSSYQGCYEDQTNECTLQFNVEERNVTSGPAG